MYRHIDDGMILNQSRAPVYSGLSHGQSQVVSSALISFEKGLRRTASLADALAFPLQVAGIPILCTDLVSMQEVPAFRTSYELGAPTLAHFRQPDIQSMKRALSIALKYERFEDIVDITSHYLEELEKEPRFNCLVRHFIESARRVAGLAPQYQKMANTKLSAYGAKLISKQILRGHIKSLEEAAHIDLLAAPIQIMNIPMICQDVPPIPMAPNLPLELVPSRLN